MNIRLLLFLISFLTWLGLTWSVSPPSLVAGIGIAVFVTFLISDMYVKRIPLQGKAVLWFLYYIPVFLWQCIKANVDVAFRVINPKLPLNPGIVKVKTKLKSELGLTFLANSITLTPGTLTVDIDEENGYIYIHWIDVKDKDIEKASGIIVGRFEKILGRIFE